jgi:hypothetical protein
VSARVTYPRARWLAGRNTMTQRPTVRRLMANVTASDPLALPMKAAVVSRPPSIFNDCAYWPGINESNATPASIGLLLGKVD